MYKVCIKKPLHIRVSYVCVCVCAYVCVRSCMHERVRACGRVTHTDVRWEMLERMELSIQIHYCMCTLQSILHAVQRLIYSRGAVVIVRQLALLVRNSLHGVQTNCGVPFHPRRHAELAGHAPLHP